ncbi:MAG: hypothetical protein DDT41_01167 [candidate division WS2 bacterium]|nr:hypothetical protein [Candidatus Psychracetigena formicireducens]
MSYTSRIIYFPLAARGAGTHTSILDLSYADELLLFLRITAASGTSPTLDVRFEVADPDGIWYEHTAFPVQTGIGTHSRSILNFGGRTRVTVVVAGTTPSFTFAVTAVVKTK